MSISWTDGAGDCSLTQCTRYEQLPSRGQKSIELRVDALESGTKKLEGKATFNLNNKSKESDSLIQEIKFYKCGDGNCDSTFGETEKNCNQDCKNSAETDIAKENNQVKPGFSFKAIWNWIKGLFGGKNA
jgi:hypothetical protein